MEGQPQLRTAIQRHLSVIEQNPIGIGLDAFRASFKSICDTASLSCTSNALQELDEEAFWKLALNFFSALIILPVASLVPAASGHGSLQSDIIQLLPAIQGRVIDAERIEPALRSALADDPNDALIWDRVFEAATETTPPPRSMVTSLKETPWIRNTNSFVNSSEYRKHVDEVFRSELGSLYVGIPDFFKTYFGSVPGLEAASRAVFDKCTQGDDRLFNGGWAGWPADANQDDVLVWFKDMCEKLAALGEEHMLFPRRGRWVIAQPNQPVDGSTAERKLDVGFVDQPRASTTSRHRWSEILIPGELKSNPSADIASKAFLDIARYAREVFAAQDYRRFVLAFTLCGSRMRLWEFDRLGGIASDHFDINQDGLQFVSTILGFLWMDEEQLGFDPTIVRREDGKRLITIRRNGQSERLVIDGVMRRAACIAGRATTCWKVHLEDDPRAVFVVKDSWQFTEREEEGDLLKEVTDKGVVNVARYYHHETVFVHGKVDDIQGNVRGGMNVTEAKIYRLDPVKETGSSSRGGNAGLKRKFSDISATLAPTKGRTTSTTRADRQELPNRVHRRIIVRDYGRSIYRASSLSALLAALDGCIQGHESLHKAGILHRDISMNNLIINEDTDNDSWPSFLIDLDLAIREQRTGASGARSKTGTRAFMAIGVLMGEQHSFMHDLESFFWVLFWICIHFDGPDKARVVAEFDRWNYMDTKSLASMKLGIVADSGWFATTMEENFTPYHRPLIPLLRQLRKVVFPNNGPWKRENEGLYGQMRRILQQERELLNDVQG
ncbi:hypothetical protein VTH06DRAFT_4564 [Thermothelomyces fergusii]